MGDEKSTEELKDVVGGDFGPFPDSENAEDPLKDADGGAFPTAVNAEEPLKDVEGGEIGDSGPWTGV